MTLLHQFRWIYNVGFSSKYPVERQFDQNDCGPAVLLSILKYYGGNDHLSKVRKLCNTDPNGTTMIDIITAAQLLGFEAQGVQCTYKDIQEHHLPCIAHVIMNKGREHFLILYKMKNRRLLIGDPARGIVIYKQKQFEEIWKTNALILLQPAATLLNRAPVQWLPWLISYIKQEKNWLYQSLFLGVVYTVFGLIMAIFIEKLIDQYIPQENFSGILFTGLILAIVLTIKALIGYLKDRFLVVLNNKLSKNINTDFIKHLFKLPQNFFDTHKKGDITARIHDVIRIQQAVIYVAGTMIIDILIVTCSLLLLFKFSSILGWIVLGYLPCYSLVLYLHSRFLNQQQQHVMEGFAIVESIYINSLEGIKEILGFDVSDTFSHENICAFREFQEKIKNLGFTQSRLKFVAEFSGSLITVAILIWGSIEISKGYLQIGEMIACYSLLSYMIPSINRSIDSNIIWHGAVVASKRLIDLLVIDEEKDGGVQSFNIASTLKLDNIEFSWTRKKQLFKNIDLKLLNGKIFSLWGPSGAGKSTLVQLIQRKYAPDRGTIILDGLNAERIRLKEYRKNIAVVPQDIKIFNGTLADNIMLGRSSSSRTELAALLNQYEFADYFDRYENGMETQLGEEACQLSGGEKQMLGLARALFAQPSVMLVDEGLNALDRITEGVFMTILQQFSQNHVVLISTHNLRIILRTDYLYVMKEGVIVQQGAPQKLFKNNGYFQRIFYESSLLNQ
jgi:ATP-binding cassette subfamily B protein